MPRVCALLSMLILPMLDGCQPVPAPGFPREDRLLEQLIEDYTTARFGFYPVASTMAGWPGNDGALPSFTREEVAGRILWLADFRERLNGLRLTELSRAGYVDAIWLMSLLRAELFELEESRRWQRSPAFYAETIRHALLSLVLQSGPQDRWDALLARLESIPDFLVTGRANLETLSPAASARGQAELARCRQLLQALPEILEREAPVSAPRMAQLGERIRKALRALQDLSAAIRAAPPATPLPRLGEAGLSRYWLTREMVDWSLDDIESRAVARREELLDRITESALEDFGGRDVVSVVRSLTRVPAEAPLEEARELEKELREFLRGAPERGLGAPVSMQSVPGVLVEPRDIELWLPVASQPSRGGLILLRDPIGVASPALRGRLLRELGQYLLYRHQAQSGSLIRRVFATETSVSGWLAVLEDLLLESDFRTEDRALRLQRHYARLLDQTRLIASIRYQTGRLDAPALRRFMEEQALLSAAQARAEAERVMTEHGIGNAGLGQLLFDDFRRDMVRRDPLLSSEQLAARGLPEGLIPVRLLRFALLGEASPELDAGSEREDALAPEAGR